ncbi:MAG: tyrosine-type recombinase/integrase [Campylobacter sp.]|nr:tyrosine-type recombinase/integrase [Campylobacter sp.]
MYQKANLSDKDIRAFQPQEKQYRKAVGHPSQLYIWVNPSGIKTFFVLYKGKSRKLQQFRQGIYGVEQARDDALKIVKRLKTSGAELKSNKYTLGALLEQYLKRKKDECTADYVEKAKRQFQAYILPKFENTDIGLIKYSDLYEILRPLWNKDNPKKSRLETIHRIIGHLNHIFNIAIYDRYIDYNPCSALNESFPTAYSFAQKNEVDTRYSAITYETEIKEFLTDLINDNKMDLQTQRAVKLQILCANRPGNTAEAKWEHIDLEKGEWLIPKIVKMRRLHKIALSQQAIKILQEQRNYSPIKSKFVFPAFNKLGHLHRDSIGKAIRNMGGNNKWKNKATAHGMRSTFKTTCILHLAELNQLGLSEKTIENALSHKELNAVKYAYERQTATTEQNRTLMQWYADYLNNISLGLFYVLNQILALKRKRKREGRAVSFLGKKSKKRNPSVEI